MYVVCIAHCPAGEYDICLDNSFSTFTDKTVYLSIFSYGGDKDDEFDELFDEEEALEELEEEVEARVEIMKVSKWKLEWDYSAAVKWLIDT